MELLHCSGESRCWEVGEPWPAPLADHSTLKSQRRTQTEPPPLSLGLGPFTLALSAAAAPPAPEPAAAQLERPDAAAAQVNPELAQLQALLAVQAPQLAADLSTTGEALDASFLSRWLKARGGCAEAAGAAITAHAAWRTEFVGAAAGEAGAPGSGGIPEASITDELAARKVFLQGCDTSGCPVVVVKAARHDMRRRDLVHTKRLIAYILDSAAAAADTTINPAGQICCLFDLSGLRPRNLDVKVLAAIFEMLQQHYPERLHSLYFLNAPLIFWGVWRLVQPFVHAATRQKIHFVSGRQAMVALQERVAPQVLPAEYGGAADLIPVEVAVAARRLLCVQAAAAAAAAVASTAQPRSSRKESIKRHAGSALNAARRAAHSAVVRPVGAAAAGAAGAARMVRQHSQQLLRRHGGGEHAALAPPPVDAAQRSLIAQVVLRHVLLVGLLLRMLSRVLLLLPATQTAAAPDRGSKPASHGNAPSDSDSGQDLVAAPQEDAALPLAKPV